MSARLAHKGRSASIAPASTCDGIGYVLPFLTLCVSFALLIFWVSIGMLLPAAVLTLTAKAGSRVLTEDAVRQLSLCGGQPPECAAQVGRLGPRRIWRLIYCPAGM